MKTLPDFFSSAINSGKTLVMASRSAYYFYGAYHHTAKFFFDEKNQSRTVFTLTYETTAKGTIKRGSNPEITATTFTSYNQGLDRFLGSLPTQVGSLADVKKLHEAVAEQLRKLKRHDRSSNAVIENFYAN